jgi:hypothetical protein
VYGGGTVSARLVARMTSVVVTYERAVLNLRNLLLAKHLNRRRSGAVVTLEDIVDVFETWTKTPIERRRGVVGCGVDAAARQPALWRESTPLREHLRVELSRNYYGKQGSSTIAVGAIVDCACAKQVVPIAGFDGPRMFKNMRRVLGELGGLHIEVLAVEIYPAAMPEL